MTKEQFNHEMEKIAALNLSITTTAISQAVLCMRYVESLEAENAKLEKSAVVWHRYPEEKPIDGRYLFWDSDGNAPHVLPYNDIVVRDNPGVFSTQTHWAYLPAPPQKGEK